jgi:hypothetical protein
VVLAALASRTYAAIEPFGTDFEPNDVDYNGYVGTPTLWDWDGSHRVGASVHDANVVSPGEQTWRSGTPWDDYTFRARSSTNCHWIVDAPGAGDMAGSGNQYLRLSSWDESTKWSKRSIDPFSAAEGNFTLTYMVRMTDIPGNMIPGGSGAPAAEFFVGTDETHRVIKQKIGSTSAGLVNGYEWNNKAELEIDVIHSETVGGTYGGEGMDYWKDPVIGNPDNPNGWVKVRVDVDWAAELITAYWEERDGDMRLVGTAAFVDGQTSSSTIDEMILNSKVQNIHALDLDNIQFSPGGPPPDCNTIVATDDSETILLFEGQSQNIHYDLTNAGGVAHDYEIVELDDSQQVADVTWLSFVPASPINVGAGLTQPVTATVDSTGVAPGIYTAFLRFSNLDDCDPDTPGDQLEDPILRQIDLTVSNWTVTPQEPQLRTFGSLGTECPAQTLDDVQFTVTNVGSALDVTYTVAKVGDCDWLTLDKTGPIVITPGNNDVVTGTLDATGVAPGGHTCTLVFTNEGTGLEEQRTVTLSVVGVVWEYHGFDLDPDAPDSAGTGLNFLLDEGTKQGSLMEDPDASDGWAYHIPDSASAKTKFRTQPNMPFGGTAGVTVVARVKVTAHSGTTDGGLYIWEDDDRISATYHWGGPSGLVRENERGVETTVTGDSEYHILRMTAEGGGGSLINVNLYLDEAIVLPMPGVADRGIGGAISGEGLGFGAGSTSGTYDITFDWVTATNAGAFAPGEEVACLGRSLVLGCPVPFADADEDGDVDQDDFGALQLCFTGANGGILDGCDCFNRDGDNDVDDWDYGAFEDCATGPGIPWSQELMPECNP